MINKIEYYNMDCIEGMNKYVKDTSIDIVITSPPYNVNKKYASYSDNKSWDDYFRFTYAWIAGISRVIKDSGSFFLNVGYTSKRPFFPYEVLNYALKYFQLQNTIHWIKALAISEETFIGHYQPINSNRYLNSCHEYIFHLTKRGNVPLNRLAIGVLSSYDDPRWNPLHCRGNCWFIPYNTIQNKREHPATFPLKLPEMCIRLHNYTCDTVVLDPFVGSGTTLKVCKKLDINGIGFDVDTNYWSFFNDWNKEK